MLHSHENQPKFIWQNGLVEILMFSLVSRKILAMRNIALYSVHMTFIFLNYEEVNQSQFPLTVKVTKKEHNFYI